MVVAFGLNVLGVSLVAVAMDSLILCPSCRRARFAAILMEGVPKGTLKDA